MKQINAPKYLLILLTLLLGGILTLSCEFELPKKEAAFSCQEPTVSTSYSEEATGMYFNVSLSSLQNISNFNITFKYNGATVKKLDNQKPGISNFKIPVEYRKGKYTVEVDFQNECQQPVSKIETKDIPLKACAPAPIITSNYAVDGAEYYQYIDITNVKDIKNFDVAWIVDGKIISTKTGITALTGNDRRINVSELTGKMEVVVTFYNECEDKIPVSNLTQIPANPCKIKPFIKSEVSTDGKYHLLTIDSLTNVKEFDVIWSIAGKEIKRVLNITKLSPANSQTLVEGSGGEYKVDVTFTTNCSQKITKSNLLPISVKTNLCDTIPVLSPGQFVLGNGRLFHGYFVYSLQDISKWNVVVKNNGEIIGEVSKKPGDDVNIVNDLTNRTGELSIEVTLTDKCGKVMTIKDTKKIPLYINTGQVAGGKYYFGGSSSRLPGQPFSPYVTMSDFSMGGYEINVGQWNEVMGGQISSPWANPNEGNKYRMMPVVNVTWHECQAFINKLNGSPTIMFKVPAKPYRLPTEAEWEYAAGGGASGRTRFGNGTDRLKITEAIYDQSINDQYNDSKGTKPSTPSFKIDDTKDNKLGLYNMSGNVFEWCQDYLGSYQETSDGTVNPKGSVDSKSRTVRGGSLSSAASSCSVMSRIFQTPTYKTSDLGFRIAHD